MSLTFKRNRKGLYKVKNDVSGKYVTDWVSEDEVKKLLIEKAHQSFIHEAIEIDMEFPHGYYVNGKEQNKEEKHLTGKVFILKHWGKPTIKKTFKEICTRLKIRIK